MGFLDEVEIETRSLYAAEFSEDIVVFFFDENGVQQNVPTTGTFDRTHLDVDENQVVILSKNPRIQVAINELRELAGTEPEEGWFVTARGKDYRINAIEDDGTGAAMLDLKLK